MHTVLRNRLVGTVAAVLLLAGSAGAIAAARPDAPVFVGANGLIRACVQKAYPHTVTLVLPGKGCIHTEELVTLEERGPQGPTGPQGAAGTQGQTGSQGPQGATGAQGGAGPQGAQGPSGATGPRGPQGAQGATGAQGLTGSQGIQGPAGPPGPVYTAFLAVNRQFLTPGGGTYVALGSTSITPSFSGTLMFDGTLVLQNPSSNPSAGEQVACVPLINNSAITAGGAAYQAYVTIPPGTDVTLPIAESVAVSSGPSTFTVQCNQYGLSADQPITVFYGAFNLTVAP